jgi:hypothetical protein
MSYSGFSRYLSADIFPLSKTILLIILVISASSAALASINTELDVEQQDDRTIYNPLFFERYSPQTASDMVTQIPGFTLAGASRNNDGNNQARGLGQGDGNLLINGKRPSTKDDGPLVLLGRIPAETVERLEILNQGSTELARQSGQIVNVITRESDKTTGSWQAQVHTMEKGTTNPFFQGSVTSKMGNATYTLGFNHYNNDFPQWGPERGFDADGNVFEIRDEYSTYFNSGTTANIGLAWQGENGHEANLSLRGTYVESTFRDDSDQYGVTAEEQQDQLLSLVKFSNDEREYNYEIGGDYTLPVGSGDLKIIGLRRFEDSKIRGAFSNVPTSFTAYLFNSRTHPIAAENIIRTLYTLQTKENHTLEFALEGVKNTLKTSSTYEEDNGFGFQPLFLDGSDIMVGEERAEASIQYSRPFGDDWIVQASLAAEYSKISVRGENPRSESFLRPKGFLSASWAASEKTRLRGRLERSVGQLNFYDFASRINVNEGTTNDGNTGLVPDQTLRAEFTLEQQFGTNNMLTVTAFAEQVDDFITFIPFEDGTEGRGNIDKLSQTGLDVTATIATDTFGIPGGKLDLMVEIHAAKITDPVTGEKRSHRWNGYLPLHYELSFRQDIPNSPLAWGIILEERSGNRLYRLDQSRIQDHKWPQAHRLFFEHKDVFGMTFRVEVEDVFGFTYQNSRTFYAGDRNGPVSGWEASSRHSPWMARLSLTGNF